MVVVIAIAHVGVIGLMTQNKIALQKSRPEPVRIMAELLPDAAPPPIDSITLEDYRPTIEIALPTLPAEFVADAELVAPRIDPNLRLEMSPYLERAQLPYGTVATVLLLLDIAPDGSVMSAAVVRSNAGTDANEAAMDYARHTRWSPGTIDGSPRAMQASLTVVLGESA